ncbi:tyrosine-type recombinase/integrase [Phenylobacterium sp. VNQ135]|uniref:tyrosine-type recombinase/integrase n=1 Tax=Phenylobacterium sp. VNQ135 TaxID=3400922 RepID=UPI003C11B188
MTTHTLFDGRVQIYRRSPAGPWQAAARVGGQRFRQTTGEMALDRAKDVAEEWYLDLRGKLRTGRLGPLAPKEKTFGEAAQAYLREVRVLAASVRSPSYVEMLELRMNAHVLPFFKDKPLSAINKGLVQRYRVQRAEETIAKTTIKGKDGAPDTPGKPPARSTMLQEIVLIRQVLKHAEGLGWIPYVPSLSTPYMTQGKKGRRAWFSHEEYTRLYQATRRRIREGKRPGWKGRYEDLHDFVLIMANTGLRPDEAWGLEFRDVSIEDDYVTKDTILVIDVRGKTGVGYCKSMPNAVYPFETLRARREQKLKDEGKSAEEIARLLPTMKVFPDYSRDLFNKILEEENLKFDRDGRRRTAYSLRHTYISMRLMEGANIHQIANNCRTSVQMIEQFYAAHIKDRIDASAINVMRPKAARKAARRSAPR